ncbi:MAG: YdcF family protein [Cyanobacteria bacterium J06636_16]
MRALKEMGVPEAKITGERCSKTTWENGLFSKILLHAQAGNRIVLVTDEPHMIRAFLVFRGFGFDVTTHPISHESESFFSPERWRILLREHVALFAYATSGKLQASSITKQRINQVKAHERIVRSGCYLQEKATL